MEFSRPYLKVYEQGGVEWDLKIEPTALHSLLFNSAKKYPQKTALIFYGHKVSYAKLAEAVRRATSVFFELGLRKGDRVAVMLPNCPDFVIAYYAILSLGGIVVNTNPLYVEREIQHQVNDSGSKMIITLSDLYFRVKNIRESTSLEKVILTGFTGKPETLSNDTLWFPDFYAQDRPPALEVEINPMEDLAVLQYTGGTTGVSKGAMLTHYNLYANSQQTDHFFIGEEKKQLTLTVLPLFHVYGMTSCMNLAMAAGTTMILVPRFVPEEIAQIIKDYKPTFFPGVPTMFIALLNCPEFKEYDAVMVYNSGGAPMPVDVILKYQKLLAGTNTEVGEGYGLSESSPTTHCNPIFGEGKPGSIGIPFPATDAAVLSPTTGEFLPVGEVGELVIKGPQVMKGYWNMPEQSAVTLRDGWLYTGDMARMDEDGYFYIVDRKKDMIIASGYNIYPREIEEVLFEHPKVQEAVVAGVPDAYRGETVKAYIVLKQGDTATLEEFQAYCKEKLAPFKVPKKYEFRDELPKSAVGKLLRRKLVEEERKKLEEAQ
ncbi:long-chain acyl-CoA synthetase [Desulfotomaculum arcticum]|uniref:Long-chain acyl-CoA synthetase n=1 Tax=Desulfotruncus arcticus DSM 17038 TaxID=1121424 RepID=A0A1I2N3G0_9FIRM|nr:long-chain fatty acid--CoA ligase [Desulfotruncus arcticus]SFF97948.1 long-chain acyl-CoA synthetase [Desulfotomaculum arcticum] [Desulfotruncus arcticus DSM 17038]